MVKKISLEELRELYDKDFPLWAEINLKLLKEKAYEYVDWEHLLEEMEDMARADLREGISHLARILEHLYKWDHFRHFVAEKQGIPVENVGYSWIRTVERARSDIEVLLENYPSLRAKLPMELEKAWRYARKEVKEWLIDEGFEPETIKIPEKCPYTYETAMTRNLRKELT
jgi:hypothetical protein